ncbi:MFS transporter [Acrocarpospora catenulata]|uniref:MFS transporter n=1 Tax=Acrocarpospora catenulata TaxID=2836182 RepID=UPI001BDA6F2E|nr:MFS transporter [Acrocarpospora catenulata]
MDGAVRSRRRAPIGMAYVAFVVLGVTAGVGGVLIPAQMIDYGVDKATIGLIFFTSSAGFLLAGATSGPLIHRVGTRAALGVGGLACLLVAVGTAVRPPFLVLLALQVVLGYGHGLLESVLNAYLAELPEPSGPLNLLHAFFGVGALVGPTLAAWVLLEFPWTAVWWLLALVGVPLLIGFLVAFPGAGPREAVAATPGPGLLRQALREPAVLLGTVFLAIYVGLEMSVGNWAFTYLVDQHGQPDLIAGYAVTGYWMGLTLGRFLINPIARRIGLTPVDVSYVCLAGVTAGALLVWLVPVAALPGLALLGFFLGPLFPTTMVVVPRLTAPRLMPTAVGAMVGGSVVGGAVLPWLAGALAQQFGVGTLLPYAAALAVVLGALWWRISQKLREP